MTERAKRGIIIDCVLHVLHEWSQGSPVEDLLKRDCPGETTEKIRRVRYESVHTGSGPVEYTLCDLRYSQFVEYYLRPPGFSRLHSCTLCPLSQGCLFFLVLLSSIRLGPLYCATACAAPPVNSECVGAEARLCIMRGPRFTYSIIHIPQTHAFFSPGWWQAGSRTPHVPPRVSMHSYVYVASLSP